MSVAKIIEVKATSKKSFEDAIMQGIKRTAKTVDNIRSAWVKEQEVKINEKGDIEEYRVLLKITFVVHD